MANKKKAARKIAKKKTTPKKKAAPKKKDKQIQVFSRNFLAMEHRRPINHQQVFVVICNIDRTVTDEHGNSSFTDLEEASRVARIHRVANHTHRVSVITHQS